MRKQTVRERLRLLRSSERQALMRRLELAVEEGVLDPEAACKKWESEVPGSIWSGRYITVFFDAARRRLMRKWQ